MNRDHIGWKMAKKEEKIKRKVKTTFFSNSTTGKILRP